MDVHATELFKPSPDYMDNYSYFRRTKSKRKTPGYPKHQSEVRETGSRLSRESSYVADRIKSENSQSKVQLPRGRLGLSHSNSIHLETPRTLSSNNQARISPTKSKTSYHLPMVYFIVKNEVLPVLPEQISDKRQKASLQSYAAKSRHKFLHIRTQQKHRRDVEVERAKKLGASVGLKVEPAKTHIVPRCLPDHPTTPFNTMSDGSDPKSPEAVFLNPDDLTDEAKTPGHASSSEEVDASEAHHQQTPSDVEMPEQNPTKEPYTMSDSPESSKKVHFNANSSRSKSCDVQLPTVDQHADDFQNKTEKMFKANDTPVKILSTMSMPSTPRQTLRRTFNPIKLPKIDLLAPIYDELILKTFQAFMSKNPFREKSARAFIQRVSAFLHPAGEMPDFSLRKTPSTRPQTREMSFFSTEPDDSSELQYIDMSTTSMSIHGKSLSMLMRDDVESRQRRTQLHSTCFLMPPPGLDREKTDHYQTLVGQEPRPEVFIPSSG